MPWEEYRCNEVCCNGYVQESERGNKVNAGNGSGSKSGIRLIYKGKSTGKEVECRLDTEELKRILNQKGRKKRVSGRSWKNW